MIAFRPHSRYLLAAGLEGARARASPASYLTGYLAGKRAVRGGAGRAIMYAGTRRYTERMSAALKGIVDCGDGRPRGIRGRFPDRGEDQPASTWP